MSKASRSRKWVDGGVTERAADDPVIRMPDKAPGQHRFTAMAVYYLTARQALEAHSATGDVFLDHENRLSVMIGCIDCERTWEEANGVACEAPAFPWNEQRHQGDEL